MLQHPATGRSKIGRAAGATALLALLSCSHGMAAPSLLANTAAPSDVAKQYNLFGSASYNDSAWHQHLESGLKALNQHQYFFAQAHLYVALEQLRRHNINDARAVQTRVALGEAYLGDEKLPQALHNFLPALARAKELHLQDYEIRSLIGLAETYRLLGDNKHAEPMAREALSELDQAHIMSGLEKGKAFKSLAGILSAAGLKEGSIDAYRQAVKLLDQDGSDSHELADALYHLGIELRAAGKDDEAAPLFERAFAGFDKETKFDTPLKATSRLTVNWEEASPRSRQIADPEYPLKYALIGNLRVAATPIRSENVIAVLISLANCGTQRLKLAVGPVSFHQLLPRQKEFLYVPQHDLDLTLEEEHVTELTWRRRWLNHIEKTRYIPGFLKNHALDADNFFSNNTFGEYGHWPTIACNETPIVTREELLYGKNRETDPATINFLSRAAAGFHPTFIDPGEAKTGLVFFKQERFDHATLHITIGNTVVEIPFDGAGPR